ncbi:MAG: flagellar hook basal-body protein [Ferrovibrio sp.]|uniref:flagellar hook basal-body protein n=1 Tax=Ferrovibrio sp. TaxID=1917215 RepID=UPI00262F1038|nr:flagellar hook basal-body protein [Ferrovibrio sp.]MCW0235082.1 flagellar hook basal-body protein [Ferrovibrio sp.]
MTINGVMSVAVQAITAQSMAISNISDNVANATTVGYKAVETQFLDVLQGMQATSSPVLGSTKQGGVIAYADFANRGQGQIVDDDSDTSAAISGNGFFAVAKPTGVDPETGEPTGFENAVYYTRQGDFHLDSSGRLVNSAGYYLMGSASGTGTTPSVLTIDTGDNAAGSGFTGVSIGDGGVITAHYSDKTTSAQGQVLLANFREPDKLDRVDGNAFIATTDSGAAVYGNPMAGTNRAGIGTIVGGALEQSTVDTANQMTKLIVAQQAYSMNSQVIQTANAMMSTVMDMKG